MATPWWFSFTARCPKCGGQLRFRSDQCCEGHISIEVREHVTQTRTVFAHGTAGYSLDEQNVITCCMETTDDDWETENTEASHTSCPACGDEIEPDVIPITISGCGHDKVDGLAISHEQLNDAADDTLERKVDETGRLSLRMLSKTYFDFLVDEDETDDQPEEPENEAQEDGTEAAEEARRQALANMSFDDP